MNVPSDPYEEWKVPYLRDERELIGTLHPEATSQMATNRTVPYSLTALADKYGTDKGTSEHNYTPLYEDKFRPYQTDRLTLLELGIWKGASLRMWRDYFPNAKIVGLDRREPLMELNHEDIIQVQVPDQADKQGIDFAAMMHGPFNIIIDDASHISSKTIASFQLLWPHLAPGGIYVIEDLQTSYDDEHYGTAEASPDPSVEDWTMPTAMQWCKRLADEVNHGLYPDQYWLGYDIASVEFHLNICFIRKSGVWAAR